MLVPEVHEKFYLSTTKFRAATVVPRGLGDRWAAVVAQCPRVGSPWQPGTV